MGCCSKCNAMTGTREGLEALISNDGYEHYNWYDIQEAAAQGCAFCKFLFDRIEYDDWVYADEDEEDEEVVMRRPIRIIAQMRKLTISDEEGKPHRSHPLEQVQLLGLIVLISKESDVESGERLIREDEKIGRIGDEFYHVVTHKSDLASRFVPGRTSAKELTPVVVGKIRQWLDDCVNEHPACPRHTATELPRRVLDVGGCNGTIRLYESHRGETAQYATLSYCWGKGGQQLTTTTGNLQDHMVSIPVKSLPQTIRDAVEVCQKISIRYLWVDALCIVQDDDDDKIDQIACMGLIYKQSTVTVVAASAEKVADGFLTEARPKRTFQLLDTNDHIARLPMFIDDDTTPGTVYLRTDEEHIASSALSIFSRGWTFQELLLSPRVIMFDTAQITLKCLTCNFEPVADTRLIFSYRCTGLPGSVFGAAGDLKEIKSTPPEEAWVSIIEEYSRRDLTQFDDRLPALTGIATELQHMWDDTYLVGFWKRNIIQHLAWVRSEISLGYPPFEGIGWDKRIGSPSWSWVTAPFKVEVPEPHAVPDARLVDSSVQLASPASPFGKVRSASITLEARVLTLQDMQQRLRVGSSYDGSMDLFLREVELDYPKEKPDFERCIWIYLGASLEERRSNGPHVFLVVEECQDRSLKRVGCTFLEFSFLKNNELKEKENYLFSVQKTTVILE
ncbi:heterokaryon incompatibility protein-domain-containing protein [Hypoxylon rubiginosum]|uniref:Heterokaryon incompatibility protein-domain-containing protein n=1 Tax=Hypoxylon rubiginosum TaxID=110542 RepID=A0ACC0DAU0_9PEZI|nr:heterokaryon incompatibility protein-domain-containing protein [Hypoxylon rubiginosum]